MTTRLLTVLAIATAVSLAAAACGGSGSKTPTATPGSGVQFDPSVLSSLVVLPTEGPPGADAAGRYNPPGGQESGVSFTSLYSLPGLSVQSTVARFPTPGTLEETLNRLRRILNGVEGPETDLSVPGARVAYLYTGDKVQGLLSIVVIDQFIIQTDLRSPDGSQAAAATDKETLLRYTTAALKHVQDYLGDPAAFTPVAGAPQFTPAAAPSTPGDGSTTPAP